MWHSEYDRNKAIRNPPTMPPQYPTVEDHGDPIGYVYFIGSHDLGAVKIGYAKKPTDRCSDLQTGSPHPLFIWAVIRAAPAFERVLHDRFSEFRLNGEWFRACPAIMQVARDARAGIYQESERWDPPSVILSEDERETIGGLTPGQVDDIGSAIRSLDGLPGVRSHVWDVVAGIFEGFHQVAASYYDINKAGAAIESMSERAQEREAANEAREAEREAKRLHESVCDSLRDMAADRIGERFGRVLEARNETESRAVRLLAEVGRARVVRDRGKTVRAEVIG